MTVMKKTCLIVADGERARLFLAVPDDNPRRKLRLIEQATLHNAEIVKNAVALTAEWNEGVIVLPPTVLSARIPAHRASL
ncbi:MAG: hypothetical protein ACT4PS_06870 [Betaproteobacteria bacterium]